MNKEAKKVGDQNGRTLSFFCIHVFLVYDWQCVTLQNTIKYTNLHVPACLHHHCLVDELFQFIPLKIQNNFDSMISYLASRQSKKWPGDSSVQSCYIFWTPTVPWYNPLSPGTINQSISIDTPYRNLASVRVDLVLRGRLLQAVVRLQLLEAGRRAHWKRESKIIN